MADRADYDELAEQCIREAQAREAPEQRALLLMMAQAWKRLAQRSEQLRTLFSQNDTDGAADYRKHAAECMRLLGQVDQEEDRHMLRQMAESWLKLAAARERPIDGGPGTAE